MQTGLPKAAGLYNPENEHDSCGIGFVAHIKGQKAHEIVERGLDVLINMTHRGAESADNSTGDGAGILMQIPHEFILAQGVRVPAPGEYGTGLVFLPPNEKERKFCEDLLSTIIAEEKLKLIGFRDVPVDNKVLGDIARKSEPNIRQIFIRGDHEQDEL